MKVLGMIETRDLVTSIRATGIVAKVVSVTLQYREHVGDGLVTIMVRGDVGAVRTAIDASTTAAERVGILISIHVIPRPHEELEEILGHIPTGPDQPAPSAPPAPTPESKPEEGEPLESEEQESDGTVVGPTSLTTKELEHMAVAKLRAMVGQIGLTNITCKETRFAKREEFLAAIAVSPAE